MTSQDGLALLKQMHQRGEITDEQYDTLRRHVLWGTPLPEFGDDVPVPRSGADPAGGYVPGAATVGPARFPDPPARFPHPPDRFPDPPDRYPAAPPGSAPRRYASRRERREAEEARGQPAHQPLAGSTGPLPPVGEAPPRHRHRPGDGDGPFPEDAAPTRRHRRGDGDGPFPEDAAPTRRHRRGEVDSLSPDDTTATRRHRHAPPEGVTPRRADRTDEPEPDRRARRGSAGSAGEPAGQQKRRPRRRSVVAVLTSVVLALALAAGGVYWFELRRHGLPPAAYARQACGAVRDWQQAVDSSNAGLINQISRQQDKTAVQSDVTAYYTTIAGRTDQLRVAILDLGPADLTGGREYADSLAAAMGDQASGLRRLAGQAGQLNPAAATFPTDLQGILTGADTAVSAVTAALARPASGITTDLRTALSNEPACVSYVG